MKLVNHFYPNMQKEMSESKENYSRFHSFYFFMLIFAEFLWELVLCMLQVNVSFHHLFKIVPSKKIKITQAWSCLKLQKSYQNVQFFDCCKMAWKNYLLKGFQVCVTLFSILTENLVPTKLTFYSHMWF